jgi:hypothetical protein
MFSRNQKIFFWTLIFSGNFHGNASLAFHTFRTGCRTSGCSSSGSSTAEMGVVSRYRTSIAGQRTSWRSHQNSPSDVFAKNRHHGFHVFRLFQPVTVLEPDQYGWKLLFACVAMASMMNYVVTDWRQVARTSFSQIWK